MKHKSLMFIGVSIVTVMMMTVYLFGVHHGRTGEILAVIKNYDDINTEYGTDYEVPTN